MPLPHSRYPHLPKDEIDIWERWLNRHGEEFYLIEYDVRCGTGAEPPDDLRAPYTDACRIGTMRRIDAVAHQPGRLLIIEVTKHISFRTIGQYYGYPALYRLTYFPQVKIDALLVAEGFLTDLRPVADSLRIAYELV